MILRDNPVLGIFSSIGGFLVSFFKIATPVIQFLSLTAGLCLTLLIIVLKIRELKRKGNEPWET